MLRTHTCGQLNKEHLDQEVELCGWVHRRRDHGGVIFIDLRDRYGLVQIKFNPEIKKETWQEADKLRSEWVVRVKGKVVARPEDMVNSKLESGEVEVAADELEIFSRSQTPPFEIEEEKKIEVNEETRMKYRYLDLRKPEIADIILKRHYFVKFIRDYLCQRDFAEIETPYLSKSTPEGARDFLVPSRLHHGQFYALPQSPQQYKQLLMISGMDKYFQLARCFRDEDTRGDRQAEFTQLDLEVSFAEREDVLGLTEDLFTKAVKEIFPEKEILFDPWPRLDYQECMLKYGTDKPDLRFGMEIQDLSEMVASCQFKVFTEAVAKGGVVRALVASGGAKLSRAQIDDLTDFVVGYGAKGLAYIIVKDQELQSPIVKFVGEDLAWQIVEKMEAKSGDVIFFGADSLQVVRESLGALRNKLASKLELVDDNKLAFAFVIDFPLFEEETQNGYYAPEHHMFTQPNPEDIHLLDKDPSKVRSTQYDMTVNGTEAAGGSIRIHDRQIQEKVFDLIGFQEADKKRFSHFLRAFDYGVPPHGGIASGLERLLMVIMNKNSIRDIMPFPKTGDGRDLMMETPAEVEEKQLKELGLKVKKD